MVFWLAMLQDRNHRMEEESRNNEANWFSLSYLSLSVFLLKQMDRLLSSQSESSDPSGQRSFQPTMASNDSQQQQQQPWHFNSLNILFLSPEELGEVAEIDVIDNERAEKYANNYAQVVVNLMKATEFEDNGMHCIWTAYCHELNTRAGLQGDFSQFLLNNSIKTSIIIYI